MSTNSTTRVEIPNLLKNATLVMNWSRTSCVLAWRSPDANRDKGRSANSTLPEAGTRVLGTKNKALLSKEWGFLCFLSRKQSRDLSQGF
ncbi:MAG TPA: hypothetical protein PK185_07675 [Cyclobacteriaceae bacterium]|nr:hypothetical protein [Cyclobacteriaceae bacterium]